MRTGKCYDNTVGSRLETDLAYIAGFLDGDGSIMLQVKTRSDTTRGVRFMATICFYQDTRHEKPLHWIREVLEIGYIARRNDGMTELRINGYEQVSEILTSLQPYIRFKEKQVNAMRIACMMLSEKFIRHMSKAELHKLVNLVFEIRSENYKSRSTLSKEKLSQLLSLTP